VLVHQPHALLLELPALVAVGLVLDRRAQHPVRDDLAVERHLELRLGFHHACLVRARQVAEEALAGESPQLGRLVAHRERGVDRREVLEPLVDRFHLVGRLLARVMEVGLLVELRDEPVGPVAEGIHAHRHGP